MKLFMPKRKEKDTLISYDTNSKLWLSMQQTVLEMLFVDDQEKNIKKMPFIRFIAIQHMQMCHWTKLLYRDTKYPSKTIEKISKIDLFRDDCDKEATLLWEFRNSSFACASDTNDVVVFFRLTRSVSHWSDKG